MSDLNITLEEENLEQIVEELKRSNSLEDKDHMDTHNETKLGVENEIILKYKCDICNKRVMTKKGLKLHISRMHEKSMERIERENKQRFACNKCDIKRSTNVFLKSHMKLVHGDLKRDLSEIRKRPKQAKAIGSPPSLSPTSKKAKEEDITVEVENSEARVEEDDLEARINDLRRPNTNALQNKIDDLERLLTASGEVIANLEQENNQLNAKAEFYVELADF